MRWVRLLLAAVVAFVAVVGGLVLAAVAAVAGLVLMMLGRATGRVRVTTNRGRRAAAGAPAPPDVCRSPAPEGVIDVVATEIPERR
jgi:hypothetical protein